MCQARARSAARTLQLEVQPQLQLRRRQKSVEHSLAPPVYLRDLSRFERLVTNRLKQGRGRNGQHCTVYHEIDVYIRLELQRELEVQPPQPQPLGCRTWREIYLRYSRGCEVSLHTVLYVHVSDGTASISVVEWFSLHPVEVYAFSYFVSLDCNWNLNLKAYAASRGAPFFFPEALHVLKPLM